MNSRLVVLLGGLLSLPCACGGDGPARESDVLDSEHESTDSLTDDGSTDDLPLPDADADVVADAGADSEADVPESDVATDADADADADADGGTSCPAGVFELSDRVGEVLVGPTPDGFFVVRQCGAGETGFGLPDTFGQCIAGRLWRTIPRVEPIAPEFQVNSEFPGDQNGPRLDVLADGRIVVAWNDASETTSGSRVRHVELRVFWPDGTPAPTAHSTAGDEFTQPFSGWADQEQVIRLLALDDGGFLLRWSEIRFEPPYETREWLAFFGVDARPRLNAVTGTSDPIPVDVAFKPVLATVGGFIAFVTIESPSGPQRGFATFHDDGSAAATAVQAWDSTGAAFGGGTRALDTVDGVLLDVVAVRFTDVGSAPPGADLDDLGIRARLVQVGPDLSLSVAADSFAVNGISTGIQGLPAMAFGNDTFLVVWWDRSAEPPDSDPGAIRGRRFQMDGTPLDASDQLVNLDTAGDQSSPTSTWLPSVGCFVVTWRHRLDGSSYPSTLARFVSPGGPMFAEGGEP